MKHEHQKMYNLCDLSVEYVIFTLWVNFVHTLVYTIMKGQRHMHTYNVRTAACIVRTYMYVLLSAVCPHAMLVLFAGSSSSRRRNSATKNPSVNCPTGELCGRRHLYSCCGEVRCSSSRCTARSGLCRRRRVSYNHHHHCKRSSKSSNSPFHNILQ